MKNIFYTVLMFAAIRALAFCSVGHIEQPLSNIVKHDFLLVDSIISTSSNMQPNTSTNKHYSIKRNIFIEHDTTLKLLYFGKDTFQMYGGPKNFIMGSSPHFLSFDNDSIKITKYLSGVGTQQWLILKGTRK